MRIVLHIGPEHVGADRLQAVLADKRERLASLGVLYPRSPGNRNHTRLFMAVTDPDHVDPLRFNRGLTSPDKQAAMRKMLGMELAQEIAQAQPELLILSASQLGASLHRASERDRLRDMLAPFSDDIRIVAHLDAPGAVLARHYAAQVFEGRAAPLSRDLDLKGGWWAAALNTHPPIDPAAGQFEETQGAPFWLDYRALKSFWEEGFGPGSVTFRAFDADVFAAENVTDELAGAFGVDGVIGKADPARLAPQPSAAWLARGRQLNALLLQVLAKGDYIVPRQLWRAFMGEMRVDGPPIDPAALSGFDARFAQANTALAAEYGLDPDLFTTGKGACDWTEADPTQGFRASQYLLAFMYRIERATKAERKARKGEAAPTKAAKPASKARKSDPQSSSTKPTTAKSPANGPSAAARKLMPPLAIEKYATLSGTAYAPHNRIGAVNEEALAAAFTPVPPRQLPDGSTGNVIVGCMKNEAPYIVEWVAYHRAIGVDNFLIYTNGCEDGTSEILDRLQAMGVLQHRNNDNWQGNSPQQYALDQAQNEEVLKNAEWIIHIDVDEFINVRCGNGTLPDFMARVPDATNVAMTWRMFGHNGVTALNDDFVIDQFDTCAPKYCPKPHTAWGFKTMFRNIGAYGKISCHRPNKLTEGFEERVQWVNGSGQDMTREAIRNGWRNSRKSVGYDLIQLNHYALRSAESFLIKRQRGRALHVDRSIGLNYWIRMDWGDYRDVTIKRNLPRLRAEYDALMQDATLREWHAKAQEWHRAKARELHGMPEFQELYEQALTVKLDEVERAAYALALDLES